MKRQINLFGLGLATLFVGGMLALPLPSLAQDAPEGADQTTLNESKIVALDLEGVDLYQALTLLFRQAKVQYSLDNSLRGTLVTMHVKQPFKRALEATLKASSLPITYQYQNGVYSVVPIIEQPDVPLPDEPTPDTKKSVRFTRIRVSNLNGIDIVAFLGGRVLNFTDGFRSQFLGFNPLSGSSGGGFGGGQGGSTVGGFGGGQGAGGLGNFGGGAGGSTFATTGGNGSAIGTGGRGF
ncbi:MAG: hypothetical protein NT023_07540 [Armatimonadetes bacterium]|nr:hypothetical protein [Armatimonadota bacterium]